MNVCERCGKSTQNKRFCSNKCRREWFASWGRERELGKSRKVRLVCENCGKVFYNPPSGANSRFCSRRCTNERQREELRGKNNPNWKGGGILTYCKFCGKEFPIVPSLLMETGNFCSQECLARWKGTEQKFRDREKEITKIRWTDPKFVSKVKSGQNRARMEGRLRPSERQRRQASKLFKQLNKDSEFNRKRFKAMGSKPTKPEQHLLDLISRHNLPYHYTGDGRFPITMGDTTLKPDFSHSNGRKKVIEVFGSYWHSREDTSWQKYRAW